MPTQFPARLATSTSNQLTIVETKTTATNNTLKLKSSLPPLPKFSNLAARKQTESVPSKAAVSLGMRTAASMQNIAQVGSKSLSRQQSSGLLATELRALRRQEFDNLRREKEILGNMIRAEIEACKQKSSGEEIRRIRQECAVKAHPVKPAVYRAPAPVKPSDRPLTEPRSPRFSAMKKSSSMFNM